MTEGQLGVYDFIFGRDYMSRYGIDLMFSEGIIKWDGMQMAMKGQLSGQHSELDDSQTWIEEQWNETFAQQILDSKYEKQDLFQVAQNQIHLPMKQRQALHTLLEKYNDLFQGQLGEWPKMEVTVELTKDAVPFHCGRPIRIPHIHSETLKKEAQRLVDIGVLEVVDGTNAGPWCAPSFIVPKKDGRVRFITDYRELNKSIRRKPWPMPHITDLIQDIGAYTYVTAIDLSMGYYHLRLSDELSDMSTFILPFGLFKYRRLPMGLSISPDLFQERMLKLFGDLPFTKVFLDDLLIFSHGTFEDHLQKVEQALERLHAMNLAVNARKSFWAVKEVDYLGFRLTPAGVMPQAKKVKAIMQMATPRTKRQLRRFIGLVNYYRFMWRRRSHLIAPLSALIGKGVPFKWKDEHQKAFEEVKRIVSKEVLLAFPDYTQRFQIYTDASDLQLGAILKQGDKTLAFFSKKLTSPQRNYGVGEKEMLSVIEALKEFRTMIFGYPIDIYTDHQNWTYDKVIRNSRVLRWRLLLEEFAPTFHYIKGKKNVVADALSRLPFSEVTEDDDNFSITSDAFDMTAWRNFQQPLTITEIEREQKKDLYVKQLLEQAPDRLGSLFEDIGKKSGPDRALTEKDSTDKQARIIVPKRLTRRLIQWYHTMLVHPGVHRLYNTL